MPGFTTHYLFGVDACRRLTSTSMHNMIRRDHSAYALGLQGPDLFFYYLPSYLMHRKNIGDLAHRKDTGQFFGNTYGNTTQQKMPIHRVINVNKSTSPAF